MKNRSTIFTLAILAAVGAQSFAQTVTIQNTFNPGTTISASAINDNFSALAAAINYQANTTDANQTSAISSNTSAINTLKTSLDSTKWAYTSNILSYTPSNGYLGIGTSTPHFTTSTISYFSQIWQNTATPTVCIANTNTSNTGTDPNVALDIWGGNNSGNGGAVVQFFQPDGIRSGWISQNGYKIMAYANASDRRLKEGIVDTRYSLDQLMKIQVRDFIFKNDPAKQLQTGFIAQELYEVYPDAVCKPASEDGTWGVDYGRLSPIIVKSIQDQQKEIEALEQENAELKARLAAIEKKLGM